MARTAQQEVQTDSYLVKQAKRIGFTKMLDDANQLLETELTEAQRIFTNDMRNTILKHLEEVSE